MDRVFRAPGNRAGREQSLGNGREGRFLLGWRIDVSPEAVTRWGKETYNKTIPSAFWPHTLPGKGPENTYHTSLISLQLGEKLRGLLAEEELKRARGGAPPPAATNSNKLKLKEEKSLLNYKQTSYVTESHLKLTPYLQLS